MRGQRFPHIGIYKNCPKLYILCLWLSGSNYLCSVFCVYDWQQLPAMATIALRAQSLFSPPVFTGGRSQDHHLHSAHGIDNKLIPVDVVFAIPNPHSIPQRRWICVGNGGLQGDDQSVTRALSHGGPPAHHCPSPNLLNQPSLMYIEITSTHPHVVATIWEPPTFSGSP